MRRKVWWILGGVIGLALVGTLIANAFLPRTQVGGPVPGGARVPLTQVDHRPFGTLLQKYVDDRGRVAYRKWKANADDVQALDDYLAGLGTADLSQPATSETQVAYWVNAYNALTLKGILMKYPTRSIRDHTPLVGYNIWKHLRL